MKRLKIIRGWIRLYIWGVCPLCNHDAPELYDCPVCEYYGQLPRYRACQSKEHINSTWNAFNKYIRQKKPVKLKV